MKQILSLALLLGWFFSVASRGQEIAGRFAPGAGKVLVFVGGNNQTVGGTEKYNDGYVENVGIPGGITHHLHFSAGWTNSSNYRFPADSVSGLETEIDWGTGPMNLKDYLDSPMLARCAIHIAIFMEGGSATKVADGSLDHLIKAVTTQIASYPEHPFFIQIGQEFDTGFEPGVFKQAFQRIVDALRVDKLPNVAIIYSSSSAVKYGQFERFDPGSKYYDWIGYSWRGGRIDGAHALDFARKVGKPVFVTEAAPLEAKPEVRSVDQVWQDWFAKFFEHIEQNQDVIRAFSHTLVSRESQMPEISDRWRQVMNLPMYLNSVDKPFSQIGFPAPYQAPQDIPEEELLPYQDFTLSIPERIDDLLERMTLEEKIVQLTGWGSRDEINLRREGEIFTSEFYRKIAPHGIGAIGPVNLTTGEDLRQHQAVQNYFLRETRLGIPALRYTTVSHGLGRFESTSFPVQLAISCSWNPELVEKIYSQIGREARSRGIGYLLGPGVDVTGDLRWGRVHQTLGEDPFLAGRLGAAMVKGLQGGGDGRIAENHAAATLQHFAGAAHTRGGRNRAPYPGGKHSLLNREVEPFRYIIHNSRPAAIAPSLCEIDGLPGSLSQWLLRDVLRTNLGFEGLVVDGEQAIEVARKDLRMGQDDQAIAAMALRAGLQLELPNNFGYQHLGRLFEGNEIDTAEIDRAVRAVLDLKFRLGLFEKSHLALDAAVELTTSPQTRELALEAARQAMVLLKNDGILPLDKSKIKRIAVIGPNSDVCRLGAGCGTPWKSVSLLDGIKSCLGEDVEVLSAKGCIFALNDTHDSYLNWRHVNDVNFASVSDNQSLIDEAEKIAIKGDVIILALGENAFLGRQSRSEHHLGDSSSLDLTESQVRLAEKVIATGKPVILYLSHGRPLTLGKWGEQCRAILTGHYAGQETGTAAAEVIFGATIPSGKLTVSWPKATEQMPIHYNQPPSAMRFRYVDSSLAVAFPFGHGLSYTTYEYGEPTLSKSFLSASEVIEVSFDVTNKGNRAGTEIAQLYVSGEGFPVERPGLELKGFSRVSLAPGETRTVTIPLAADDLHFYDGELKRVLPVGQYTVQVGGSSRQLGHPAVLKIGLEELQVPITSEDKGPRPNILFVAVDDLRPELGVYGSTVKTPNMDKLAVSGVRFDRAYCQQADCGASRLSVMSGLYPTTTGEQSPDVGQWRARHPGWLTMNQYFTDQGYQTIGLGKIFAEDSGDEVDRENWSSWIDLRGPDYLFPENLHLNADTKGPMTERAVVPDYAYVDGKRAVKTAEFLKNLAADKEKPFFLAVGFSKPHLPFTAPARYWDLYPADNFKMPPNRNLPPGYPPFGVNLLAPELKEYGDFEGEKPADFSEETNRRLLHGYAASVSYVDACLGLVFDGLQATGLAENTIVVLWSDHGLKLGDHGSWSKHTNFECDTRVPLLIRDPRTEGGKATTQPVELIDLYPTLCDMAGVSIPSHCEGRSFRHLLSDPEAAHRLDAYSSHPTNQGGVGHSIRFRKFRYTEWYDGNGTRSHRVFTDLEVDPGEETNLVDAPGYAADLEQGETLLKARLTSASARAKLMKSVSPAPEEQEIQVPEVTAKMDLSEENRRQVIDGFGGSLAFWGTSADDEALQAAVNGLNTQIIRAQGEVSPSGEPDHNRDILNRAMNLNPNMTVLLTFWQPRSLKQPDRDYWLDVVKVDNGLQYELKGEREDEWADEMVARIGQYLEWGINVGMVGVQNEANWSQPGTQTCRWDPDRLADFIEGKFRPRLKAAGHNSIKIVAPDLAFLGSSASEVDRFIPTVTSGGVDIVSYHMYDSYNEQMDDKSMAPLVQNSASLSGMRSQHFPEKRLWMTETTGAQWNNQLWHTYGWKPEMSEHEKAIKAASYLHTTLVDVGANAFLWWGLIYSLAPDSETRPEIRQKHRDEGLILVEEKQGNGRQKFLERTRKYYTFRQFSGFVKPGYQRIHIENSSDLQISSFISQDDKVGVVVAINDTEKSYKLKIEGPGEMKLIGTFQTDAERNCSPVDASSVFPTQSVRTMVFSK